MAQDEPLPLDALSLGGEHIHDEYEFLAPCDPEVPLRFELGARVACRVVARARSWQRANWVRGVVVETRFTEEDWNEEWPKGTVAAYSVQLDDGLMIYAPMDSADCIRGPADFGAKDVVAALEYDQLETLRTLLEVKPSLVLGTRFQSGQSLLHIACEKGKAETVELLLEEARIPINLPDDDEDTPLLAAVFKNQPEVVALLLASRDINVNSANDKGATPLLIAAQNNHPDIVELLLEAPCIAVNFPDAIGVTPLHTASERNHEAVVKLLLDMPDVEVDCANDKDATALYVACKSGHAKIAQLLLHRGASVDLPMYSGATPLMAAVFNKHEEVVRVLVRFGARTHAIPTVPFPVQPEVVARCGVQFGSSIYWPSPTIAKFLRCVKEAGGIQKYRGEPRMQLVMLHKLCQQGRATPGVINIFALPGDCGSGPLRHIIEYWWSP